jgi:hypothetical protein
MEKKPLVNVNYRIPERLRQQFKAFCARRGLKMEYALANALEAYMAACAPERDAPPAA